jgi:hypothetical protein
MEELMIWLKERAVVTFPWHHGTVPFWISIRNLSGKY